MDIIGAFVAGVLSFLSPCIVPILPGYLSFITGYTLEEAEKTTKKAALRRKSFMGALCFGAGFGAIFILMGATATVVGRILVQNQLFLSKFFGVVVLLFGLHMMGLLKIKFLYREKKVNFSKVLKGRWHYGKAFVLGLAFAIGWTPCVGPILGGILTMAAHKDTVLGGIVLLSSYSLGLWLPFLLAALFTVPVLSFLAKHPNLARRAEIAAGAMLTLMGILMVTGQMTRINAWFE